MAYTNIMTTSLLSANNSMKIARVQHSAKNQMDGHAGVLDAEIKLDSARGGDVKKKQEELDKTREKASEIEESTMNTLSSATNDLKKAAKDDLEARRAEKAEEKRKAEKAEEKKKAEKAEEEISPDGTTINVAVDSVTPSTGLTETVGVSVDEKA